jgi:hypothetical protein
LVERWNTSDRVFSRTWTDLGVPARLSGLSPPPLPCYPPSMTADFSCSTKGLEGYAKALRETPRRLKWATAFFLTELAAKMRVAQLEVIRETMTVRDKRFVDRHVVFQKAQGRSAISAQIARAGSYEGPRFSGWREQVEGGKEPRTQTAQARTGGTQRGKLLGRVRLRAGNKFPTPQSIRPRGMKNEAHRLFVFLLMMSRARKRPFVIDSQAGAQPGIWTLEGRHGKKAGQGTEAGQGPRLQILQKFGADRDVEKNDWNEAARDVLLRRANTRALWTRMWQKAGVLPKKKTYK